MSLKMSGICVRWHVAFEALNFIAVVQSFLLPKALTPQREPLFYVKNQLIFARIYFKSKK